MGFLELHLYYSKCGPWTSGMGITWELCRGTESWPTLDILHPNLHVNKTPVTGVYTEDRGALLHAAASLL